MLFRYCGSLARVDIPAGVTSIERFTFGNCGKLSEVRCNGVTPAEIDLLAFDEIPADSKLYVPKGSYQAYYDSYRWRTTFSVIEEMEE